MATNLKFSITLKPVGYDNHWPEFYLKLDNQHMASGVLHEQQTYNYDSDLENGPHSIIVGFTNKNDDDTLLVNGQMVADKAIIVESISIEGYKFDDFLYQAQYYPVDKEVMQSSYISWNGEWRLDITTPIFTWLHRVQHLGWVYEKNI
jgi:hypothetical protein